MITTKDLNRKQQIFGCFLPDTLIPEILPILKAEGIPYDVRHWKDLTEDKTLTGPVIPMYKKYIEQARSQYEAAGYPDPYCIGILNVPFRPDAFFAFTQKFFGPGIDKDYQEQKEEQARRSQKLYETCYEPHLTEGTMPVKQP